QNPAAVSDSAGEGLELYNPGSAPVDLSGCILRDDDTDAHTIAGPLTILPGGFAVLGRNGNPAENGGLTLAYTYTGFTLANGGDEVVLHCGSTEVDRVAYDGGTTFPAPAGASMQLLAPALDNSAGDNWCVAAAPWPGSAGDYGSPGAANLCPTTVTLSKHGPAWALPGSVVSYTIALTNTGPAAAVGGVLTDVLPPQAQFGGWLAPAPTGSLVAGSLPTWAGTLPGGMTFTLRFTATLTAAPGDILTNTARFRAQNAAAAAKTALTVIARPPAPLPLLLTKTVVPTAAALPGGAVTYTIALSNSPAAAPAAAALGDVLPPQVRFGAWLSQSGAVRAGRVVTWAGVLAPGERRVWRFTAAVSTGTVLYGATVTNTARYTAGKVSGAAQAHFKITSAPPPVPFKRRVYVPLILHLYPRVARISVRPPAGPVGTTFQFHLSGFIPAEGVSLWLIQPGGAQTTLPNAVINPDGTYDAGLAVVYGSPWPPGAYTVCARGERSQTTVCAGFVLTG
ncbi:MAG: lamin tail domain-containing protein, partial [Anaerolineae bacterium]